MASLKIDLKKRKEWRGLKLLGPLHLNFTSPFNFSATTENQQLKEKN